MLEINRKYWVKKIVEAICLALLALCVSAPGIVIGAAYALFTHGSVVDFAMKGGVISLMLVPTISWSIWKIRQYIQSCSEEDYDWFE